MKRLFAMILALALMLTAFAACGKDKPAASGADAPGSAGTAAPQTTEETPAVPRLTLVSFGDGGVLESARAGCERLEAEGLIRLQNAEYGSGDLSAGLQEAGKNSEIVVCVSSMPISIKAVAEQYSDVRWICVDGVSEETPANVLNLVFKQNEGAFLAGYVAAAASKTGVVGAVGGESPVLNDYILGFEQGARYYRENITVLYDFISETDGPDAAKDCALRLNAEGADVILQAAGKAGAGVIAAAGEKGFYVIGTDSDQRQADPDRVLCSVVKSVGDAVYHAVKNDNMWGQSYVGGLVDGLVSLSYGDGSPAQPVADDVQAEVQQIIAGIRDGSIVVDGLIW